MRNRVLVEKSHFHVDETNKVIVCTLWCNMQFYKHPACDSIDYRMFKCIPNVKWEKFIVKAKARCSEVDTFDIEVGKRIAESRAKVKMYSIATRVYKLCSEALSKYAKECEYSTIACKQAMEIEDEHVLKLTK